MMAKKKVKLPKSVAGVKIPKILRQSDAVTTFLTDDLGRAILKDVLVAAAGAAAAAMAQHRPSGSQLAQAGDAALDTRERAVAGSADAVQAAAGLLGSVLTEAFGYIVADATGKPEKRKKDGKAAEGKKTKGKTSEIGSSEVKKTSRKGSRGIDRIPQH